VYSFLRNLLFCLPAETSHSVTLPLLDAAHAIGAAGLLAKPPAAAQVEVMGLRFPNPVGLAAGLDKNADHIDALAALGFGFIEVGTLTPRPQPGNPKPRLFRLTAERAIINRMGFNNKGIDHAIASIQRSRFRGILGVNIGKNFDTPVENAVDDYLIGMRKAYEVASYLVINLSSPNTPGLRTLQFGDELQRLLQRLKQEQETLGAKHGRHVPFAIKVAPDLASEEIASIAEALLQHDVECLIATNTTLDRQAVQGSVHREESGGLSGAPLTLRSTEVIRQFAAALDRRIPIIGVGGIMNGADAAAKIEAGASLVQIYSGFIYRGPELISEAVDAVRSAARATSPASSAT